ncbi:MAG: hypothetical protein ACTS73_01055 [Arsenophonus sp. NEOnobi-MAG3]
MRYHLSLIKIIHEINQQEITAASPKLNTPEMSISRLSTSKATIFAKDSLRLTLNIAILFGK